MFNEEMRKDAVKYGIEYVKKGRVLVWHDEFDKDEIDTDKWIFWRTMSGADQIYDNCKENCRIDNGQDHMQAHRTDDPEKPFTLSEGLTTKYTMNWKYGYLEMRAKIPFRHGAWPSFWTQSSTVFQKTPWMCETDIFEVFSSDRNAVANLHKWGMGKHCMLPGGEGSLKRAYTFEKFENLNDEYHVYGYEWDPEFMTFYVDGEEFAKFPIDPVNGNFGYEVIDGTSGFHDFQFIIVNNEIFTEKRGWAPEGSRITADDELPIDYYIDWMRLYQNPEKEEIKLKPEIDEALAAKKAAEEAEK